MNSNHGTKMVKKPASKSKTVTVETKKTNKEIVLDKFPKAECKKTESGFFHICVKSGKEMNSIHSGISRNESDAWKRAAHEVM